MLQPKVAEDDGKAAIIDGNGKSFGSVDDIIKQINTDPKFANQVLQDLEALESASGEFQDADEVVIEKSDDEIEEVVEAKIKPSWLGTYAKNRTPEEAVQEMHKGGIEKDRTIDFLRKEKIPTLEEAIREKSNENLSLKKQLDLFNKNQKKQGTQQTDEVIEGGEVSAELPPFPQMPIGEDAFDEEKVTDYNKKMQEYLDAKDARTIAMLEKSREEVRQEFRGEFDGVKTDINQSRVVDTHNKNIEREFIDIEDFRNLHQKVFGSDRTVREIENDFISFLEDLAHVAGIDGGIYKDGHTISDEVNEAYADFKNQESEDGEELRTRISENGIKPPTDLDVLNGIYYVRGIRQKYGQRLPDGSIIPLDWENAYTIAQREDPTLAEERKFEEQLEIQDGRNKAIQNRKSFATEPNIGDDQNSLDVANMTNEDLNKILSKHTSTWTELDLITLDNVASYMKTPVTEMFPQYSRVKERLDKSRK